MTKSAFLIAVLALAYCAPSQAAQWTYEYKVKHPNFGDVGTYTNVVEQTGTQTKVRTRINVLVKFLGLVVYRQEADRQELWNGDRLTAFQGTTSINGKLTEIRGEAQGDAFVVSGPKGTFV